MSSTIAGQPSTIDLRSHLERRIEQLQDLMQLLVTVLDVLDGDCDLEDNGDSEPSLGSLSVMLRTGEVVEDGEYDDSDNERSLLPLSVSQR